MLALPNKLEAMAGTFATDMPCAGNQLGILAAAWRPHIKQALTSNSSHELAGMGPVFCAP